MKAPGLKDGTLWVLFLLAVTQIGLLGYRRLHAYDDVRRRLGVGDSVAAVEARDAANAEVLAPDVPLDRIRDMSVAAGALWVLDRSQPFLLRVSLDDGSTLRFGHEGSGPGELVDPVSLDVVGGPEPGVVVWDLTANRTSTFAPDGRLLHIGPITNEEVGRSRGRIRDLTYAEPLRIRALEGGVVAAYFPGVVRRTADVLSGSLRIADERLSQSAPLVRFADLTPRSAVERADIERFLTEMLRHETGYGTPRASTLELSPRHTRIASPAARRW